MGKKLDHSLLVSGDGSRLLPLVLWLLPDKYEDGAGDESTSEERKMYALRSPIQSVPPWPTGTSPDRIAMPRS